MQMEHVLRPDRIVKSIHGALPLSLALTHTYTHTRTRTRKTQVVTATLACTQLVSLQYSDGSHIASPGAYAGHSGGMPTGITSRRCFARGTPPPSLGSTCPLSLRH